MSDIENVRICKKCNKEKVLNDLNFGKTDGKYYKGKCRHCENEERRTKRKTTNGVIYRNNYNSNNIKISGEHQEYKIERNLYMFNESEIAILRNLISKNNEIMAILKNRVELNPIEKNKRVPKSLNIEIDIFEKLQEYSKTKNISISDIVNVLLREGINTLK